MLRRTKLQQAMLYFMYHCDDQHLGKTKLMKLLYFLDFDYYQEHRESVTGARYERFGHGPVAPDAMQEFEAMQWAGMIEIEHVATSRGTQHLCNWDDKDGQAPAQAIAASQNLRVWTLFLLD